VPKEPGAVINRRRSFVQGKVLIVNPSDKKIVDSAPDRMSIQAE
jgi:hypothetical protein